MQKAALYTSSAIFAIGATAHIVRLIMGFEIIIAGCALPMWASALAALAAGFLAVWMLSAARGLSPD